MQTSGVISGSVHGGGDKPPPTEVATDALKQSGPALSLPFEYASGNAQ